MSNFDGPQFINPSHTSFGQTPGTYQNPFEYKLASVPKTEEIVSVKRKPGSDWNEEETLELKNVKCYLDKPKLENFKSFKSSDEISNKLVCFEYENKLIDDLLNFQGISNKHSDSLLKEFLKKSKTLNKQKISSVLLEKLSGLMNSTDKNSTIKIIKGLYIIESLLQKQYDSYHELFKCKINLVQSLANKFSDKKVNDLAKIVLKLLGSKEFDGLEVISKKSNDEKEQHKKEFSFIKNKNSSNKSISKEDLKDIGSNIFGMIDLNHNTKSLLVEEEKKGFSFIKSIKSEQNVIPSSNPLIFTQINDLFSSQDNISELRNKNIQSTNLLNLDELYAEQSDLKKNYQGNLSNYSINYHQNYNIELSDLTSVPLSKENKSVHIEKFADNISNEKKEATSKTDLDHFNFVKDLMKKKL